MRSAMQHQFSQVPRADIPRSSFDRSHNYKTTFDAGWLIPVFVDEVLPGDTFNLRLTSFGRLATPLHPFMDNIYLDTFFFFVPNRLVWNNWQRFMGEQPNPGDSTDFLVPQIQVPAGGFANSTIYDYFGIPTQVGTGGASPNLSINALPFRAYTLIYNEWFRDQNLQNSVPFPKTDGPDLWSTYALKRRGKRHDYFTSSLPWPQKGPAVQLPLGSSAPIRTLTNTAIPFGTTLSAGSTTLQNTGTAGANITNNTAITAGALSFGPPNQVQPLYADLSSATASTINALRQSFQIQRIYERDARGGTRYTELIQAHFGVTSPDARLQRPEYLGGSSVPMNVNPIAQTSSTPSQPTPQGNLAAMGTFHIKGTGFTKSFTEHGYVIGLISARADLNYQQGLNRMWSRNTRWDFYWPALAHIGEQAVLMKEIYALGTAADSNVWGYQERFAEYRYKPSVITGEFRSNFAQTLDTWHLAQQFLSPPSLGATFIEENPPIDRVIAVTSSPQFLYDSYVKLVCARPMPVYSVPGLIDHF